MSMRFFLIFSVPLAMAACTSGGGGDPVTVLDDQNAAIASRACDCFSELAYRSRADCDGDLRASETETRCVEGVRAEFGDVVDPTLDCATMLSQDTRDCFGGLTCSDATALADCLNIIDSRFEDCPSPATAAAADALDACGSRLIPD